MVCNMQSLAEFMAESFNSDTTLVWDYPRHSCATAEKLGYKLEGPHRVDPYVEFILKRMKPSGWKT